MIRFRCPHPNCGARLKARPQQQGKRFRCPRCGEPFLVPDRARDTPESSAASLELPLGKTEAPDSTDRGAAARPGPNTSGNWQPGRRVLDRYEIHEVIGEGGFGTVHRVHHRLWNLDLAVKSPRAGVLQNEREQQRFAAECETWVELGLHPHIVTCHYVRNIDGAPRVFMELVEGGSLKDWIAKRRLGDVATALDIAIQIAWGLGSAHEQNLVHRDVKPGNVLVTPSGIAKVTDFGLARAVQSTSPKLDRGRDAQEQWSDGRVFESSTGAGTPGYAAPEQAAAGQRIGPAADIFALGVTLWQMLGGRITWSGELRQSVVAQHAVRRMLRDGEAPGLPKDLVALLLDCLAPAPEERPKEIADVAEGLVKQYEQCAGERFPRTRPATLRLTWDNGHVLADRENNRAVSLMDLGQFDRAQSVFGRALERDPHCAAAHLNLALFAPIFKETSGDLLTKPVDVPAALSEAVRCDPRQVLPRVFQATLLARDNRDYDALQSLDASLKAFPNEASLWDVQGTLLLRVARPRDAVASLVRAAELEPGAAERQYRLGQALGKQGQTAEARRACERALQIDPEFEPARRLLDRSAKGDRDAFAADLELPELHPILIGMRGAAEELRLQNAAVKLRESAGFSLRVADDERMDEVGEDHVDWKDRLTGLDTERDSASQGSCSMAIGGFTHLLQFPSYDAHPEVVDALRRAAGGAGYALGDAWTQRNVATAGTARSAPKSKGVSVGIDVRERALHAAVDRGTGPELLTWGRTTALEAVVFVNEDGSFATPSTTLADWAAEILETGGSIDFQELDGLQVFRVRSASVASEALPAIAVCGMTSALDLPTLACLDVGARRITALDLLAHLLSRVRRTLRAQYGTRIANATLSVPVGCDYRYRARVMAAAELAGIPDARTISEVCAVPLASVAELKLPKKHGTEGVSLILDANCGDLSVALVELSHHQDDNLSKTGSLSMVSVEGTAHFELPTDAWRHTFLEAFYSNGPGGDPPHSNEAVGRIAWWSLAEAYLATVGGPDQRPPHASERLVRATGGAFSRAMSALRESFQSGWDELQDKVLRCLENTYYKHEQVDRLSVSPLLAAAEPLTGRLVSALPQVRHADVHDAASTAQGLGVNAAVIGDYRKDHLLIDVFPEALGIAVTSNDFPAPAADGDDSESDDDEMRYALPDWQDAAGDEDHRRSELDDPLFDELDDEDPGPSQFDDPLFDELDDEDPGPSELDDPLFDELDDEDPGPSELDDPLFDELVAAHRTIPFDRKNLYTNGEAHQRGVTVVLLRRNWRQQGAKRHFAAGHERIAECHLDWIADGPPGSAEIEVEANVDASSQITLTVRDTTHVPGRTSNPVQSLNVFQAMVRVQLARHWASKGAHYRLSGQPWAAEIALERALSLDPGDNAAWADRGQALEQLDRSAEALYCLHRALERDTAQHDLARLLDNVRDRLDEQRATLVSDTVDLDIATSETLESDGSSLSFGD